MRVIPVGWIGGAGLFLLGTSLSLLLVGSTWKTTPVLPTTQDFNPNKATEQPSVINADLLRVGISNDSMEAYEYPSTQVSASGPFQLTNQANHQLIVSGNPNQVFSVHLSKSGFWVKTPSKETPLGPFEGPVVVEPLAQDSLLKIPGISRKGNIPFYRGRLEVVHGYSSPTQLSVVNVLPLQDYLKAVVPNELPARYGLEAIKAQAVAARNYALHPREKPWPQFDICDSQYCQAYYGAQTETPETSNALKETDGLLALYQGEPILALYSSSHGGYAEDYSNAFSEPKTNRFPAPSLPYLKGGPDVSIPETDLHTEQAARAFWLNPHAPSFDTLSPFYRWTRQWNGKSLTTSLNHTLAELSQDTSTAPFVSPLFKPGDSIGTLRQIHILQRGLSGKAMALEIEGSHGKWLLKKEFVIRKALAYNGKMLPSANIILENHRGLRGQLISLTAHGGGFGHGVGMSQLGASWMDHHGYAFPQIIQHYYKGVCLGSLPLQVGNGQSTQPIQTSFYSPKAEGKLWVVAGPGGEPVTVEMNQHKQIVIPDATGKAVLPITLAERHQNQLVLYPDSQEPNRKMKVWVEVFASQPDSVVK